MRRIVHRFRTPDPSRKRFSVTPGGCQSWMASRLRDTAWLSMVGASLLLPASVSAQDAATETAQETAEAGPSQSALYRFTADVTFMADDKLQGRDTYSAGAEATAQYIIEDFKRYGIKSAVPDGSYRQPFEVDMGVTLDQANARLSVQGEGGGISLKLDEQFKPQMVGGDADLNGELVFVGYGISDPDNGFDEYADVDVENKVVVMLRRQPKFSSEDSPYSTGEVTEHAYIRSKVSQAKQAGAIGIIFVNDLQTNPEIENDQLPSYSIYGANDMGLPFVAVTQSIANQLFTNHPIKAGDTELDSLQKVSDWINENEKPVSQGFPGLSARYKATFKPQTGWGYNICGVIEGEGPYADETIVIGGHYDHLGLGGFGSRTPDRYGEVHNGADDNATGTAAVMELARRFAQADTKPSRRLVFIAFSGEERGLLGSYHYVQEPIYPMESTVAMVNFDMIGWLRNDNLTIYGTGTSSAWESCLNQANTQLELDLNMIAAGFAGSDHLPFSQNGIPAIFIHTGLTPTYHTPEDDTDSLDLPNAVRVVDYSEAVVQEMLAVEEFPFTEAQARRPRRRPPYLGTQLDFENVTEEGLTVTEVTESSPADEAGIEAGDVITKMDDQEIKSRDDVIEFLGSKEPADKVTVHVLRDGETKEIMVILGRARR